MTRSRRRVGARQASRPAAEGAGRGRARATTGRTGRPTWRQWAVGAGLIAMLAGLGAFVWAGAAAAQRDWIAPEVAGDVVVARVHGEPVSWGEVAQRMKAAVVMGRPAPGDLQEWREEARQTIESVVGDVLTRHTVEARGFVVTDAMIEAEIRQLEEQFGGVTGLDRAMSEMQVTMAELRETKRRGLYLQALIDLIVPASDADVNAYLAQAGAQGLSRSEAAARVRAERAADVVPLFLADLRNDPGIWVIDTEAFE